MLVLTRKLQEQILIGENIRITVLRVKGNKVRIGIDAPTNVRVVRGELGRRETCGPPPQPAGRPDEPSAECPGEGNVTAGTCATAGSRRGTGLRPVVERVSQRCFPVAPALLNVNAPATAFAE